MSSQDSDAELLARVSSDPQALEELYRRHVGRVTAYAVRRCKQPADVVDLVAATFLAVIETSSSYNATKGEVLPWIVGIAGRIHLNRLRRRSREYRALSRLKLRVELNGDDFSELEQRIDAERQSPHLEYALSQLKAQHREALRLVAQDGLTHSQAAQALGVTQTTLRKRLSRARAALRKELGEEPSRLLRTQPTGEASR